MLDSIISRKDIHNRQLYYIWINFQKQIFRRNMAKTIEKENISLELFPSSVSYKLEVPNFFKWPRHGLNYFEVSSAPFEFVNSTWCFHFINPEECESDSEEFGVTLVRLKSAIQKQKIRCTITLLVDDDEDMCLSDEHAFTEDSDDLHIATFENYGTLFQGWDKLTLVIHLICTESTEGTAEKLQLAVDKKITSLSEDFKNVLLNGKDYNLTFSVKDKKFQAHQDILRARSEVFQSMLTHDRLEKNTGVIDVPDCEPEAFEQFLYYVYTGKVESLDTNNMLGLYYVADKYNMEQLKEDTCDFIKKYIDLTNVCDVIDVASKHSYLKLLDSAFSYFYNNVDDILPTVKWQLFMGKNPTVANELVIKSLKVIRNAKT